MFIVIYEELEESDANYSEDDEVRVNRQRKTKKCANRKCSSGKRRKAKGNATTIKKTSFFPGRILDIHILRIFHECGRQR